jgi:cyanophycinase
MTPTLRRFRTFSVAVTLAIATAIAPAAASGATIATFVPIGSGYTTETLEQFAAESAEVDDSGAVSLLVVPITFATDAFRISNGERQQNLTLAETRRSQVEAACDAVVPAGESCSAVLAPVLVRDDAFDPANVALVTPGLDGIYILGGDQVVAMQVVANTPFEDALAAAQAAGAVTSGNSAGAAVQSADMIAGYVGNNGPEQGFEEGAVDLWLFDGPTDDERGLVFGLRDLLLDQHVLQRGRIARLINASITTGQLGIGMDAETAATIEAGTDLTEIGGLSAVFVADPLTFGSFGQFDGTGTLAVGEVATHVLPAGDGYDIATREPLVGGIAAPAPDIAGRVLPDVTVPSGAGALLLGGGRPSAAVLERLVAASGGPGASIAVVAVGYPKAELGVKDAKALAAALSPLGATATGYAVDRKQDAAAAPVAIAAADGILLTAPNPSAVLDALAATQAVTDTIESAWRGGAALLADDAAASALGTTFTADPRPGVYTSQIERAAIAEFRPDSTTLAAGLGWIATAAEPGIVSNRHWGRLYSVIVAQPPVERVAFGIDAGTAVEFDTGRPLVAGESVTVVLDGRYGTFGAGTNGAIAARWVLLDTFVGGQAVE